MSTMDDATAREILERLERLESKVDAVVAFTNFVGDTARAWTGGSSWKALTALAKIRNGNGT